MDIYEVDHHQKVDGVSRRFIKTSRKKSRVSLLIGSTTFRDGPVQTCDGLGCRPWRCFRDD